MRRHRLTAAILTLATVTLLASPALAQPQQLADDPVEEHVIIDGLDILGERTTASGLVSITRTQALFERRLVLERSFLPEIAEEASTLD